MVNATGLTQSNLPYTEPSMIETPRLILREWRESDRAPFRRLNADPRVMEYFQAPLTPEESDRGMDRLQAHIARHGFGFFAAEIRDTAEFAGFIGIAHVPFQAHFTPANLNRWRLAEDYWNRGLATEGAAAIVKYGFGSLGLSQIVSFTAVANLRSRRVMEKLGMTHDVADDFDHPHLPDGHTLRRHVLYRLTTPAR